MTYEFKLNLILIVVVLIPVNLVGCSREMYIDKDFDGYLMKYACFIKTIPFAPVSYWPKQYQVIIDNYGKLSPMQVGKVLTLTWPILTRIMTA